MFASIANDKGTSHTSNVVNICARCKIFAFSEPLSTHKQPSPNEHGHRFLEIDNYSKYEFAESLCEYRQHFVKNGHIRRQSGISFMNRP